MLTLDSFNTVINTEDFTATYSPEDDKLRLYTDVWLGKEDYQLLSDMGFKWAPKQELIYTHWSPKREDICILLAGEIEREETTLVERAEQRAARFDGYQSNRLRDANSYQSAAARISERFAAGQPILCGHHSEKKARSDKAKMERAQANAVQQLNTANYWCDRAEGVEQHANYKANPRVRANRIKTLLKELRDEQRVLNDFQIGLRVWQKLAAVEDKEKRHQAIAYYAGMGTGKIRYAPSNMWSDIRDGKIKHDEALQICMASMLRGLQGKNRYRVINHLLNRLGYERSELGEVGRFNGELTATILQAFLREHGAHKPSAKKSGDSWTIKSAVSLPLHIADDMELTLTVDQWRELMQKSGYEVPAPAPKKAPILNFKADHIVVNHYGKKQTYEQIELTKEEYKNIYSDHRGVKMSACGEFRVKICTDPNYKGAGYAAPWVCVFLTDSKTHPMPESESINQQNKAA